MGQALLKKQVYSKEEYLKLEEHNEYKSEFHDGDIFAMAGGSYKHSAICSNLHRRIGNLLDEKDCMLFDSNLKLAILKHNAFVYPDMMVVCGKIEFYENQNDIIQNPTLIVEVLSPSTESFDRGRKFEYYRTLASLTEYILVSQKEPIIETYFKQNEKNWLYSVVKGIEESIVLQSLSSNIALKEIYLKVESTD
ncbi:MAG: Uma2 family endonuclease [Deltaproteobacteria bacterium]|nr:Uma2 family endonuclease [Deltaproteobacteria bacterium]